MAFADLGALRLFYTDEGAGEPVMLFVHGYSCDSHDWSWQLPHFTKKHRVLAVDLRGHGRSSVPDHGYQATDFAGDLAELLDHLGIDRVVAVGHSLGGVIVSTLAVEYPDRVAAVVAVDPAYLLPDESGPMLAALKDALDNGDPAAVMQEVLGGPSAPGLADALRTWHLRRIEGVPAHVLREAYAGQVSGPALRSTGNTYLARRSCPVLAFYASPEQADAEAAVLSDPRSRVVAWEGSGHWLHQERPAELNALVDAWLETVTA
jgi:pimeloyl-ACP methyl ester carboxylesterase